MSDTKKKKKKNRTGKSTLEGSFKERLGLQQEEGEDRQDFLIRLVQTLDGYSRQKWGKMPNALKAWHRAAVIAMNDGRPPPDFRYEADGKLREGYKSNLTDIVVREMIRDPFCSPRVVYRAIIRQGQWYSISTIRAAMYYVRATLKAIHRLERERKEEMERW